MNKIIYGIHAIQTLIELNPQRLLDVYSLKENSNRRLRCIVQKLKKNGIIVQKTSKKWLDEKTGDAAHQGILARVKKEQQFKENDLLMLLSQQATPLLLILDGITDPQNLGACLRCADGAGVDAVIISRNHSAPLNAIAKKIASGAAESIPLIRVTNLARILRLLQEHNIWIVGTVSETNHYFYNSKLNRPLALVVGAEDKGLRCITKKYCNEFISIPMLGVVSSLNVSVAAAICLYEIVRQKN